MNLCTDPILKDLLEKRGITVEVFDANGKRISLLKNQSVETYVNLQEYSAGTYTLKVMPEGIIYQIVKQ